MALTVLQLLPSLRAGGVETGTVDLAKHLIAHGHRAIVISSGGPLVKVLEEAGAIHYTLPIHRKLPWNFFSLADRVAEVAESHGADILHARSRVPALIGYLAWRKIAARVSFQQSKRTQIPCFLTTAHGHYSTHLFSRIMGWGRLVIANSQRIARHMSDDFGVPAERIRMIHRGVDLSQFHWKDPRLTAPRGDWVIGCVGRLSPIKGHPDLIRAFGVLSKTFPRARLLIVGDASNQQQNYLRGLKALVSELQLEGKVEFLGHESDVPGILKQMDLMVLSSSGQEAFGRVLIEAGACGVPVVATRVGGVLEVILDQKTGLLVPAKDPMALSRAMARLLQDRKLALTLAQENRRRVELEYPLERMASETLKVYREASEKLRILVMKISSIGDVVLVTPSLRALRARFPKAHITVLVGRESRELLHRCPYLDDLVVFDRARDGRPGRLRRLGRRLALSQVDLCVDFQNNRISHWLGRMSGAPLRLGYAGRKWSWLLSQRVTQPETPLAPIKQQFLLLKLLGIELAQEKLEIWPGPTDESGVQKLLESSWTAKSQPLIVVHPGSNWASKRWPVDSYAELVDALATTTKGRVVLTGSLDEKPLCEQIYRLATAKPILAAGATSLNELAVLLRQASVFIGGDTAALHLAAATGIPIVTLFGPTDPDRHLPPTESLKLFKVELPCSPCYRSDCHRTGEGHMECMKSISVESVVEAVSSSLKVPA